jgi:hypothetical protein
MSLRSVLLLLTLRARPVSTLEPPFANEVLLSRPDPVPTLTAAAVHNNDCVCRGLLKQFPNPTSMRFRLH